MTCSESIASNDPPRTEFIERFSRDPIGLLVVGYFEGRDTLGPVEARKAMRVQTCALLVVGTLLPVPAFAQTITAAPNGGSLESMVTLSLNNWRGQIEMLVLHHFPESPSTPYTHRFVYRRTVSK